MRVHYADVVRNIYQTDNVFLHWNQSLGEDNIEFWQECVIYGVVTSWVIGTALFAMYENIEFQFDVHCSH
jgi:hypothetical protein